MKLRPYQETIIQSLLDHKDYKYPILVNASVGSGKSIIIATYMLKSSESRILCLTMNSELIRNNAETYNKLGGDAGIYCSGLGRKDAAHQVVFASPHSTVSDMRSHGPLSKVPFDIIIIDECHNISMDKNTMFQRIFNNYYNIAQHEKRIVRVIGLTGTPYRGKSVHIMGEDQCFKKEICAITTSDLIRDGYLVPPQFGVTKDEFNFSSLKVDSMGRFNAQQLAKLSKNERLTAKIMREVVEVVENGRRGAFIFCSTIKHCYEAKNSLPDNSAIIIGDTPEKERIKIIDAARAGDIKYLINVNCLTVGIDIPNFDVCAWLRPTESLVLYTQGVGRVLRLHPQSDKKDAIILDYAGNVERHADSDNTMINEALQPKEENKDDYCIPCYTCNTLNKATSRRCIGIIDNKRCEHFFDFKECPICDAPNDITSRCCRLCKAELIDPNSKLRIVKGERIIKVESVSYAVSTMAFVITYNHSIHESYHIQSQQGRNIFYVNFMKECIDRPSRYYVHILNRHKMLEMIEEAVAPASIIVDSTTMKVKKKIF